MIETPLDTARMLTGRKFVEGEKNFCLRVGSHDIVCVSWLEGFVIKYVASCQLTGFTKVWISSC
jgi:hypothetical protein